MDFDTKLINLALDCGEIMLRSGAETFRVQDTMQRILATTGREKIEATAISTALLVTLPRESKPPLAMMRGVHTRSVNFQRVCRVNDVSRAFVSGRISLDEAIARVADIPSHIAYPPALQVLGYGCIAGGCAYLLSPTVAEGAFSFLIGLLLGLLMLWLDGKKVPYFFPSFLGGVLAALCGCGVHALQPAIGVDTIVTGSIMPLLPGVTISQSVRDLLEGNLISGTTRLVEAMLTGCFLAGGVGMALILFY